MSNSFGAPSGPPEPLPPPSAPSPGTAPPRPAGAPPPSPPAAPPPPPPGADMPSPRPPGADLSTPAAAPSPPPGTSDIDSLIAQLHAEMDLEPVDDFDPNAPLTTPVDASRPERVPVVVIDSTGGLRFDPEIPSLGARLLGLAVDAAVLALLLSPGALIVLFGGSGITVLAGLLLAAIGFGAATVLYTRQITTGGQSLGNRVAGTNVVDVRNGAPIDNGHAATRYVVRFLVSPVFLLGYLVAFGNRQRRTFHDTVAGSVVTRPARASWSIDNEPA